MLYNAVSSIPMLWDNLEEWDGVWGRKEAQEEMDICIPMPDHAVVCQTRTQYCTAIILQLKINKLEAVKII